jgi:thiamine-phosphate pyrophosphorylase
MNWKRRAFKEFKLYAVTDLVSEDASLFRKVEAAYRGGADIVQLRSKVLREGALYRIGIRFRRIADRHRKLFFVNDRLDLALAVGADGVHLGQEDLPMEAVKKILRGRNLFIGRSTHSLKQALEGERQGADYISVGPILRTPTKPTYQPVGLELLRQVRSRVRIPFVCIGGIDRNNIRQVIQAGAKRVAVVRAIFGVHNVYEATRALRSALDEK